jgi:hypothetical protein
MAAEEIVAVAEANAELAEDLVHAAATMRVKLVGTAVIAGLVGAVGGFYLCKKLLKTDYEETIAQEIEEAKEFYKRLYAPKASPEEVSGVKIGPLETAPFRSEGLEEAVDAMQEYAPEPVERTTVQNIFKNNGDEVDVIEDVWDMATELSLRTADVPYIISAEEYLQAEPGYEQAAVTFWENDETLVDERDQMIPDKDEKVGDHNLAKFGHGSMDPNKLYVRNEVLEVDFEIARSFGSYAREVLGFEHSDDEPRSRRRRRPRYDDE